MKKNKPCLKNIIDKFFIFLGLGPFYFPAIPADGRILFFKRDRNDFPFLSNFFLVEIIIDGRNWPSVEHYYQAQKSHSRLYQQNILACSTAGQAKRLGDSRIGKDNLSPKSWFRNNPELLRGDWDAVKVSVMQDAIFAKFTQNRILRKKLLATKDAQLVEDSNSDYFWGIGKDGSGRNQLGMILMEVRSKLRKSPRAGSAHFGE